MTVEAFSTFDDRPNLRGVMRWRDAPHLRWELEVSPDGRIIEITVRDGEQGVTARGLREAPLREMEKALRRAVADEATKFDQPHPGQVAYLDESGRVNVRKATSAEVKRWKKHSDELAEAAEQFAKRPRVIRPGRGGRGERWYAELAGAYLALLAEGDTTPIRTLAARGHVSESTIRNQLARARGELGLLTRSPKGKAGGTLTDKAKEILSGER